MESLMTQAKVVQEEPKLMNPKNKNYKTYELEMTQGTAKVVPKGISSTPTHTEQSKGSRSPTKVVSVKILDKIMQFMYVYFRFLYL